MSADAVPLAGLLDNPNPNPNQQQQQGAVKKKRNLPGTPDPEAEVIALSPKTLMATNRFVCEICKKGFQRDQNLQLHRRGHNLPWKLRQRSSNEIRKRVYICPEKSCVHHDPLRALGDLTGIKKHFSRKHGEKKWKCEKCSKKYAVQTDWKAHTKTCGTREYRCDCGTLFSRKDSFITHRAFCDAMAEASARNASVETTNNLILKSETLNANPARSNMAVPAFNSNSGFSPIPWPNFSSPTGDATGECSGQKPRLSLWLDRQNHLNTTTTTMAANSPNFFSHSGAPQPDFAPELVQMASASLFGSPAAEICLPSDWLDRSNKAAADLSLSTAGGLKHGVVEKKGNLASIYNNQNQQTDNHLMSATALLQKAAQMGATSSSPSSFLNGFGGSSDQFGLMGQEDKQSTENFQDLMNSFSSHAMFFPAGSGNDDEFPELMIPENNSKQQGQGVFPLFSPGKQHFKVHPSQELENGLTRDFLGVGRDSGGPYSERELAQIASIRSPMDLSPFNSAH